MSCRSSLVVNAASGVFSSATRTSVMAAHPGAVATSFFDGTTATIDSRVADTPEYVAARTLDDYTRRRAASYPGRATTRVLTWVARPLPRTVAVRVAGMLNRRLRFHEVVDVPRSAGAQA